VFAGLDKWRRQRLKLIKKREEAALATAQESGQEKGAERSLYIFCLCNFRLMHITNQFLCFFKSNAQCVCDWQAHHLLLGFFKCNVALVEKFAHPLNWVCISRRCTIC
jgi:hypothetical protein